VRRADELCASIFEKQFGLIEREQALKCGMSLAAVSRRLASGRWLKVLPRVYRLAGAPRSCEQSLKAVTLWGGSRCVVSHETAAALHGLSVTAPRRMHVQAPTQLQRANVAAHRTRFGQLHTVTVKGIPTTSVTRTLVDLSASLPRSSLEKLTGRSHTSRHDGCCPAQGRASPLRRQTRDEAFAPIAGASRWR